MKCTIDLHLAILREMINQFVRDKLTRLAGSPHVRYAGEISILSRLNNSTVMIVPTSAFLRTDDRWLNPSSELLELVHAIQFVHQSTLAIMMQHSSKMRKRRRKTSKEERVCSICSQSFNKAEHLLRHIRSHTKEKPFECSACGRMYARQ